MTRRGILAVAVALAVAPMALAESTGQPAELPPASYAGKQYVDSQGCVFLRAGTEAQTVWVPRVTAGGAQLCGYPPSGNRVPVVGEPGADDSAFSMEEAGTSTPKETADDESAAPTKTAPQEPEATGTYFVAIGSFGFASNVEKATSGAKALGFPVTTGKVKGAEQGLVTVFAGPFDSKSAASEAASQLRAAGFPDAVLIRQ